MKWVLCYLNPNDYVTFRTDISDNNEYIIYSKFIEFISSYVKADSQGFFDAINRYFTIYIDLENKKWEIYKKEYRKAEFDELLNLNKKREEKKKLEKETKKIGDIHLYKNTITNIFNKKHEQDQFNKHRSGTGESLSSFLNRSRRNSSNK